MFICALHRINGVDSILCSLKISIAYTWDFALEKYITSTLSFNQKNTQRIWLDKDLNGIQKIKFRNLNRLLYYTVESDP